MPKTYSANFFRILIEFFDLFLVTFSKPILSHNPYLGAGTEGYGLRGLRLYMSMSVFIYLKVRSSSKTVADGALGFYCDHHVSARMSKFMYGVEYLREYDPNDPEHLARRDRLTGCV